MGCLNLKQPNPQISYYTLEYEPPVINDLSPLSRSIRIERFQVSPLYDTKNIIYTDNDYTRKAYNYHKWQASPGLLVSALLARDVMQYKIFNAVITDLSLLSPDYFLEGRVDEFYELDKPDQWKAVLTVSITFAHKNSPCASESVILQKTYKVTESCRDKNPVSLAEALSSAMSKISENIARDIHQAALSD